MTYIQNPVGNLAYAGSLQQGIVFAGAVYVFIIALLDYREGEFYFCLKDKIALLIAVILSWGLTMTALYITFTPVGASDILGVQGRYFAPLLLPFLLIIRNDKVLNKINESKYFRNIIIVSFGMIVILLNELLRMFSI